MAWLGGFAGDSYNRDQFREWLKKQKRPTVSFIAIHATGAPYTLASIGGARRMTAGLADYYKVKQKWKGGPHFFVMGDGRVYPGTPVHLMSVHSPSWNNISIAVEAEGDYRKGRRPWLTGDGKVVWDSMSWVLAELLSWLGLEPDEKHMRFHREDPRTSHRECPGAMEKTWFVNKVRDAMGVVAKPAPAPVPAAPPPERFVWVHGVPAGDSLNTRRGPGTSYEVNGRLPNGIRLQVLAEQSGWVKASTPGGYTVWVSAKYTTATEPGAVDAPIPLWSPPPPAPADLPVGVMRPTEFCISWKKRFEGLMLTAYDDVGSWAIGYGHNATSNRPPTPYKGMTITAADAEAILHADAEAVAAEVRKVLRGVALTQAQFDALVLDCFQRGQTQFTKTNTVQLLLAGAPLKDVSAAFHVQATISANAGLNRRRKVQAQIFDGEKPTKW